MNRKAVILSVLAAGLVVVLMGATAITALAVVSVNQGPDLTLEQAPAEHLAPVQAEAQPVSVPADSLYEKADYKGGCGFYSSETRLTEAPAEQNPDDSLAQVDP